MLLSLIFGYKFNCIKIIYMDMSKPTLTIIQGFIGSGKTTYSKKLSLDTGAIRLNGDEYCDAHFPIEKLETDWDQCFSEAITQLWLQAENILRDSKSVILDFGFWDRKSRDYARSIARKLDVDFQHIYINTKDEIIKDRLALRSGEIAKRNLRNFEDLKKYFEEPSSDEEHLEI